MKFSEIRTILGRYKVGIAGAGGLGSNCAAALARCGVGELVVADFDIVEEMNLNRQFYFQKQVGRFKVDALEENISLIGGSTKFRGERVRLDSENIPSIFSGCDIIVEAFDTAAMKEVIIDTVRSKMPGTPLIVASGLAGWGKTNAMKVEWIDEHLVICGDELSEVSEENPPMAPRVGIAASMQANTVIEILMSKAGF